MFTIHNSPNVRLYATRHNYENKKNSNITITVGRSIPLPYMYVLSSPSFTLHSKPASLWLMVGETLETE